MKDNFSIVLVYLIFVVALLLVIFFVPKDSKQEYEYEKRIVASGDTFWGYYNNGYYSDMNYGEALYEFKKDNEKTKSELVTGEKIVLRKVAK